MDRVKSEDFIEVLKHHRVDVIDENSQILVWKDDLKYFFPIDDGFITKKFIHKVARKFDIPPHHFFNPQFIKDK